MGPNDEDLFVEEDQMVRMTFGEHLEDLRRRLILALLGFIPALAIGIFLGKDLVQILQEPVQSRLKEYYQTRLEDRIENYNLQVNNGVGVKKIRIVSLVTDRSMVGALKGKVVFEPGVEVPDGDELTNEYDPAGTLAVAATPLEMWIDHDLLQIVTWSEQFRGLMALSVQEVFWAWMMVGIVAGLIIAAPWIIYQGWAFVAEGLYRHERTVVYKAWPASVGLFLLGVLFCFVIVLPVMIQFFFGFNLWLGVEPAIRLTEWLGFAAMLPLIFGICFELPIVMMVLDSIGVFGLEDFVGKWRHAVLIIAIVAMVITPTTDPGSMMLLMGPMAGLYFLGIGIVRARYARRGEAPPLSVQTRIILALFVLVILYVAVLKGGFYLDWVSDVSNQWWYDKVWYPATLPSSWIAEKWAEVSMDTQGKVTVTTLANGGVMALFLYRLGEFVVALFKPKKKS